MHSLKRKRGPSKSLPFLPRGESKKRKFDNSKTTIIGKAMTSKMLSMKEVRKLRRETKRVEKSKGQGIKDLKAEIEARRRSDLDSSQNENSSNLHVGNIPARVSEGEFRAVFEKYGQVTSVKFMPPKNLDTGRKTHAFVNFRYRYAALDALDDLKSNKVWGVFLRFDWGNPIDTSHYKDDQDSAADYASTGGFAANRGWETHSTQPDAWGFHGGPMNGYGRNFGNWGQPDPYYDRGWGERGGDFKPRPVERRKQRDDQQRPPPLPRIGKIFPRPKLSATHPPPGHPKVQVKFPKDGRLRDTIDTLADYVSEFGMALESLVIRNRDPSKFERFGFLFETDSSEHMYYRWRLWSLSLGEDFEDWSTEPFQMLQGGPFWIPPSIPKKILKSLEQRKRIEKLRKQKRKEESMKKPKKSRFLPRQTQPYNPLLLSESQRDIMFALLQKIKPSRKSIRTAMCFCFENHEQAEDIVDVISQSFGTTKVNVPRKLARLYLIHDVLYNSHKLKQGKQFRKCFKEKLEDIFVLLNGLLQKLEGDKQQNFQKTIFDLLDLWEANAWYTKPYIDRCRNNFIHGKGGLPEELQIRENVDGEPMVEDLVDEDLDGVPMADD